MRRPSPTVLAAAIVLTSIAALTVARGATTCATPSIVDAPDFSSERGIVLAWEQPDDERQGGGFAIEVAYVDETGPGGEFKPTIEGVVNVIHQEFSIHRSERSWVIDPEDGLPEATLYYHVRATASSDCEAALNPWSAPVSITQDYSAPAVTITAQGLGAYLLGPVEVSGVAEDVPGEDAAVAAVSGIDSVRVVLEATTPLIGEHSDAQTVEVAEDGTWTAAFDAVPLGTYQISATAIDAVGNRTEEPPSVSIVVVAP